MRWTLCTPSTSEPPPSPRSGHSAVWVGGKLVVFGGIQDKRCLSDLIVRYVPLVMAPYNSAS
eukprot:6159955-Pyramimonas_sp.AAC.2